MSNQRRIHEDGGVATAEETRTRLKRPQRYRVLIHNDDYTTMEFVVYVLQTVFHLNEPDAMRLMLKVHEEGVAVAGVFTYEVAETKVAKVISMAREAQFPLMCTMEPEDTQGEEN